LHYSVWYQMNFVWLVFFFLPNFLAFDSLKTPF